MWTMRQIEESFKCFRLGNTGPTRLDDYDVWWRDDGLWVLKAPPPGEMVPRYEKVLTDMGWCYEDNPHVAGEEGWYLCME